MLHPHLSVNREVTIPCGRRRLRGILNVPPHSVGAIAFSHGSGSGRFSPRNQQVAGVLQKAGLATLLLDLLDEDEAECREKAFDIDLLAERLQHAAEWLTEEPETRDLPLGYFGASTGAGAALVAAACYPARIRAVVSRGGRPDLAKNDLIRVESPTLLIVGGDDEETLALNQDAYARLRCPKNLVVVPGATHLFEEPGTLDEVARLARDWFLRFVPYEPIETTVGGHAFAKGGGHVS